MALPLNLIVGRLVKFPVTVPGGVFDEAAAVSPKNGHNRPGPLRPGTERQGVLSSKNQENQIL
jgi:hypothetical protein